MFPKFVKSLHDNAIFPGSNQLCLIREHFSQLTQNKMSKIKTTDVSTMWTNLRRNRLIIQTRTLEQTNQYKIKIIPSQTTENYTIQIRFKARHSYITFPQFSVHKKTFLLWLTTLFKRVGQYSQLPLMVQLVWPQDNRDILNVNKHSYKTIYTRHITDMKLSPPQGYSGLAKFVSSLNYYR